MYFKTFSELLVDFQNYTLIVDYINELFYSLRHMDHHVIVFMSLICVLIILLWYLVLRKVQNSDIKILPLRSISSIHPNDEKPRFRTRDKIRYYATRLNRKFKDMTKKLQNIKSKDQKQKLMSIFAKKILNIEAQGPKLLKRMLPDTFLEPDMDDDGSNLPEEFQLILDSIKVFGHLEKSYLLEICKNIKTVKLESGQYLFKKLDIDENIFVVKSGGIKVFIDDGASSMTIRDVHKGENIHSLLSVLDVISGNVQPYKTVHAVATMPSEVLLLSAHSFLKMFEQSPQSMVRMVQLIAMRLHRVTFLCLHNYLGLSSELMNKENLALPDSVVVKMSKVTSPITATNNNVPSSLRKSLNLRCRRNENLLKKDIIENDQGFQCRPSNSTQLSSSYRQISNENENPSFFGYDYPDIQKSEDFDIELGGTPVANHSKFRISKEKRSGSLNSDEPEQLYAQPTRKSSLHSDFNRNERMTMSNFAHNSKLLTAAKSDIAKLIGLKNVEALSNLEICQVHAGTWLIKEGEEDTDIYFVVSGQLQVLQHNVNKDSPKLTSLFITHPGEMCGISAVISTEPNYYSVRVNRRAKVVVLTREFLYSLIKCDPNIMLHLCRLLVCRMSPFLRQIDFALEWISMKAGHSLYKTGDISKNVYIILNGRFRQICMKADGRREIVNELGRGELFGFVEVLSDQPRATTIIAIRDSELAQIPSGLLSWIKRKAPHVVTRLIQLLADKLIVSMSGQSSFVKSPIGTMANLRTVAVVGSSHDVPLESFVLELQHAMMKIGASVRLTSNVILQRLGLKALDPINEHRLSSWLSQQEDHHRMVFYVCDNYFNSTWTRRCIRQADCVLVVALASKEPRLGAMEKAIESDQTKVSKILVLLYPIETDFPPVGKTSEWLNSRPWVTQHYHIRCPKRMFVKRNKEKLIEIYKIIFEKEVPNHHSDMSRLARYLTGTASGLVLGGGGARGCSHVGSIRAMHEIGIPIDMIGGTSIGSLIGALWAEETKVTQFTQKARSFAKDMNSVWKLILDLTYSPVSMFSGRAMNNILERIFKDRQIEDLWIPYFCITTDITNSKMRVHTHGSLWRFVRASMSLSGYLPPLCHPEDGSLLLDGGYINNLPADVMHEMGPQFIFAIDVGSQDNTDLTNYGDWLSGWKLLYHKFISRTPMKVLNLTEIQSRLAYVSCVRHLKEIKVSEICEYLRPPIEHYRTLQFGSFDEIQEVGYKYTKERLIQWQADLPLKAYTGLKSDYKNKQGLSPITKFTRNIHSPSMDFKEFVIGSSSLDVKQRHFIDLAELVSRIGQDEEDFLETESDEEEEQENDKRIRTADYNFNQKGFFTYDSRNNNSSNNFENETINDQSKSKTDSNIISDQTQTKSDDGYDEDVEESNDTYAIVSDPENFHRVLVSSRKKRHRRSSLNRNFKTVTFDRIVDSS